MRNSKIFHKGTSLRKIPLDEFIRVAGEIMKSSGFADVVHISKAVSSRAFCVFRGSVFDFYTKHFLNFSGKGTTRKEALASAMGEMLERWFAMPHLHHKEVLRASYKEIKNKAIDPRLFTLPKNKIVLLFSRQENRLG